MLSKLLKYEIKATGRIFLPIYSALLIFAVVNRFVQAFSQGQWQMPAVISMAVYIAIMVAMFVMTLIVMIQRFYKNLLSDEGYLMLTLPVRPWSHIVCKLLVSMLWIMASGMAALLSIMIIALQKDSISALIREAVPFFQQVFAYVGSRIFLWSLEAAIGFLLSIVSGILIVYASIAIGHLFDNHKIFASFGAFVILNTLSQILVTTIFLPLGNTLFPNLHVPPESFMAMHWVVQGAILYYIVITGLL
jgi:hypothetical protein